MSEKYIYLDWNVVKYIKKPREDKFNELDVSFSKLIKKLSRKYKTPFSEGHLADLLISYSEKNKEKVDSDLDFVNKISQSTFVKVVDNSVEFHNIDPRIGFYQYIKEINSIKNEPFSISVVGEKIDVDMKQLNKDELLGKHIFENDGQLDAKTYKNFLLEVMEKMDEPAYYKSLRENIINLKTTFSKRDTVLDQGSDYFSEISPLLDFMLEDDENKIESSLYEAGCVLSYINREKFDNKSLTEKVQILYHALDFNFHLKEKVNKKNKPSNIHRDGLNLIHALHAKYYITEDKNTKLKSKLVLSALSHKLKVLDMQEFMHKFD
ncbi:hypothetical protein [Pseudoalteromonas viridis]|uniref:Uncharacterized protein n=1 Tax=Pseudoalteromonas viridis TaxID=339617 RepID=A0ABX7V3H8_9GAMM|nr:hypothetical protein [Pseudoalteromonas viridis]QTL35005.1 hypothetical protein J5X90_15975 [Pseudoalteromonas viridis]